MPESVKQLTTYALAQGMAITKTIRDHLLVEARHRCTICAEKCFEIHHIVEQAEGGTDDDENLIVLCPNCHQHRYHRSGEFNREQLRLYRHKLKEQNEVEKRVLQNLEDIRQLLPTLSTEDIEKKLRTEIQEAATLVSPDKAPIAYESVQKTSEWLAERDLIRGGARRAIEIEWEIWKEQEKRKYPSMKIVKVDDAAYRKAPDFPAAYYLEFVLDAVPHPDWATVFMSEYKNSLYMMKRKTSLIRNRISMIVADSDNLQSHADFAKRLVESTNNLIHTRGFQLIDQRYESGKREALQEFDAIQSMKARTREIKL
jgi:hypothetical protein